jgi:response regulator of citrate/malate metabolism
MAAEKVDLLIIEDDKAICEIMKEYCNQLNLFRNIVVAADGMIATMKLQNQIFGLILLDMNLPKKNGLAVLNEFVPDKNNKNTNKIENIVIVSGTLDRDLIAKIMQRGVKNFLTKPFDEAIFKEKIKKMLS